MDNGGRLKELGVPMWRPSGAERSSLSAWRSSGLFGLERKRSMPNQPLHLTASGVRSRAPLALGGIVTRVPQMSGRTLGGLARRLRG